MLVPANIIDVFLIHGAILGNVHAQVLQKLVPALCDSIPQKEGGRGRTEPITWFSVYGRLGDRQQLVDGEWRGGGVGGVTKQAD